MEDGFKDACYAMCQNQNPIPRISQACRTAAMELPRPTVRKWCEHGYRQGFKATVDSLTNYFIRENTPAAEPEEVKSPEPIIEEVKEEQPEEEVKETAPPQPSIIHLTHSPTNPPTNPPIEVPNLPILKTIPITLDEKVYDLNFYDGQSPEESVALFCQQHMPDDLAGCIRQLLPLALDE
jgi:hypothetical protein